MTDAACDDGQIAALRDLVLRSERAVALTGAGISTESGVPDFRGPGGLWTRVTPITYQEFIQSEEARLEDWRRRFVMNEVFARAKPNSGHLALARMAEAGRLDLVITQNIDGLHQRSGLDPERLIEIHGNATHGRCVTCARPMGLPDVQRMIEASGRGPRCGCGGVVKAAVISFGESLSQALLKRALESAAGCDLFLAIGSSLVVRPAAALPGRARSAGAALVVINRDPTPVDTIADMVIRAPIGAVLARLYPQVSR
jgi:NAD-dependent deacetylase